MDEKRVWCKDKEEDSGDAQIAGISVGGLGKGKKPTCFYPTVKGSEVNPPMPRYFLGEHAGSNPNQSWSKETLTGVRKGFQACGCSLALLFIAVVLSLFHCVNIIQNRKGLKKNSVFQEIQIPKVFFTYFYEVIQHHNVHYVCMEKQTEVLYRK